LDETDEAIESLQYAEIVSEAPTFSWVVPGKKTNTIQTSYHIILSDNKEDVLALKGNVWDSSEVESDLSVSVPFGGGKLKENTVYYWRVKSNVNTESDTEWSDVKMFKTASKLKTAGNSVYPQVKTIDYPVNITDKGTFKVVDFGKDAFGQLSITLSAVEDADSVVIHLGERLVDGHVLRDVVPSTVRYHRYALKPVSGTHTYKIKIEKDKRNTSGAAVLMPTYIGEVMPFRYCEIEGYEAPIVTTDVIRESVHYPFDDTASFFTSSNDTLNAIWNLCKYSMKATSFAGVYVDGDRERIPYEADALINQLSHYAADREYSLARHSYLYLLDYPTWPTEWILQAIIIAWNDYMYTGDKRALVETYEQLKVRSLMSLREKNGLISTKTGLQTPEFLASIKMSKPIDDIVDWPKGRTKDGVYTPAEDDYYEYTPYNTVVNAYHYENLKLLGKIAEALGFTDDAEYFSKEQTAFKKRFLKAFWNPHTNTFSDGLLSDTRHSSLHSNMFPLAFGLYPEKHKKSLIEFIESRGMACSVYGSQFLLDAIYNVGAADYGLQLITTDDIRGWYNMIRVGSTISLEAWDNSFKPNQDWNHAWGAAPANVIFRKIIGVEPIEPGFSVVKITPQIGQLKHAKAIVPTIRGDIYMDISKQIDGKEILKVTIPANMKAVIAGETYCSGEHEIVISRSKR
jgi:hypothetical protein